MIEVCIFNKSNDVSRFQFQNALWLYQLQEHDFNRSKTVDDLRGVGVVLTQPITCDVYVVVFSEYGGLVVCRVFTAVKFKYYE